MKIKNKVIISILTMIIVLLVLPIFIVEYAEARMGMGLIMIFFFLINPIVSIGLSLLVGKDVKKLWWIPVLFSLMFLISYWLVLEQIILELIIYAINYLILGILTIIISKKFNK